MNELKSFSAIARFMPPKSLAYYRTPFDNVVTVEEPPDSDGYVATTSVLTGRPYGRLRFSALQPAGVADITYAEAVCQELAYSPEPKHASSEMAQARAAARRRLGIDPRV